MLAGIAYFGAFISAITCIITGMAGMPIASFIYCIAAILCIIVGTLTIGD